jgi:Ras-related C3 botulinum toxin substrate 1
MECATVGDPGIGKTALLVSFVANAFPEQHIPTFFEHYSTQLLVEDQCIDLELWDTADQKVYQKIRSMTYPHPSVFIVCFSLVSPTSLESAQKVWVPELHQYWPNHPYILVGLKSDLRDSLPQDASELGPKGMEPIPSSKGEEVKQLINAEAYIECSARLRYHLTAVFEEAVKVGLHPPVTPGIDRTAKWCEVE